jgi:hypothetical protein
MDQLNEKEKKKNILPLPVSSREHKLYISKPGAVLTTAQTVNIWQGSWQLTGII